MNSSVYAYKDMYKAGVAQVQCSRTDVCVCGPACLTGFKRTQTDTRTPLD